MYKNRSNLYLSDRSFLQDWALGFKEQITEKKYITDSLRFHSQSFKVLLILLIFLTLFLYLSNQVTLQESLLLIVLPLPALPTKNYLIKRTLLQIPCFTWQYTFFKQGTLSECFGILIPSVFLNFYSLSSWKISLCFFVFDGLVMCKLCPDALTNILLTIFVYTVILCTLEKDFRDVWRLYSSIQKSNRLSKALYDNFTGAEFLVSPEGKIIYHNRCALNLLKKLGRSVEILNFGDFSDLFPEFHDSAHALVQNSLKGQMHEELHVFKYQDGENRVLEAGFLLDSCLFSWTSGNCSRIICLDVSSHISKKELILNSSREIYSNLEHLNKQVIGMFEHSGEMSQEFMTMFFRVSQNFKAVEAMQGHFTGEIEVKSECFSIKGEVRNIIEILYFKICSHNVQVVYTIEQGIPDAVIGDKALHGLLVFSVLDFVIQNALEESEIFVLLQVAAADKYEVIVSYKITFRSVKLTNVDIESLFTIRKNSNGIKDLNEIHLGNKRFGTGIACVDTILIALKGYLLPMYSEVDPHKVIINFCLPFKTSSKIVNSELIQISQNTIKETNLTSKWVPDLGIYRKSENGDLSILKDQLNLVNSQQKVLKICVQPCENLKIKINSEKNFSIFSSVSEKEMVEGNDIQEKLNSYNYLDPSQKKCPKIKIRSFFLNEIKENKNLVVVDKNEEIKTSLGDLENLKINLWWAENSENGLKLCHEIFMQGKAVTAFLFTIDKVTDRALVEKVKRLESEFNEVISICGLSSVPADLNYCKLIDIKNFSK